MDKITIITSQHQRSWELDFDYIPSSDQEFIDTIQNAPWPILKGMGFLIWDSYNHVVEENQHKPQVDLIQLPTLNMASNQITSMEFDLGRGQDPTEKLAIDQDIILLPAEWYGAIPEGFELISISGRKELFKKGVTDNDQRFGCLAFGILRPRAMQNPKP